MHGATTGPFAINTYDAMTVATLAIKKTLDNDDDLSGSNLGPNVMDVAKPPGDSVTDYAEGSKALSNGTEIDYLGLAGTVDFDDTGDAKSPVSLVKAKEGTWKTVRTLFTDE